MSTYELPPELLQKKIAFLESEGDYQKSQDLAVEIDRDKWWDTVDNRFEAWMALQKAAKGVVEERRKAADKKAKEAGRQGGGEPPAAGA